jgi:hypothetical protein
MNLCPKYGSSLLPFLMVFLVASVSAFMTWLTLTYSDAGILECIAGTAVVFLAVGGTLLHYVLGCMKRHCRPPPGTHSRHLGNH